MTNERSLLKQIEELEELCTGLACCNMLILKEKGSFLECQFFKNGMPGKVVKIDCKILAASLRQESIYGIIEGYSFTCFRNNFSAFSLRVKARTLYIKICADQQMYTMELPIQAVA